METTLILELLVVIVWGTAVGLLAKRKNRNPWLWGIAGILTLPIALLVLAFMPYKCPKCNQSLTNKQGSDKECPQCGSFKPA